MLTALPSKHRQSARLGEDKFDISASLNRMSMQYSRLTVG